jgi:hypothetical protein
MSDNSLQVILKLSEVASEKQEKAVKTKKEKKGKTKKMMTSTL